MFIRKSLRILFLWVIVIPLAILAFMKITEICSDARQERNRNREERRESQRQRTGAKEGNIESGKRAFHEGEKEFSGEGAREEMSMNEEEVQSTERAQELEDSEMMDRPGR